MGQGITTTQFYLYGKQSTRYSVLIIVNWCAGKQYFTQTGWEAASKLYKDPTLLDTANLANKVYMVTGANSGIGLQISRYLASKKATVYIVCRSRNKGEEVRSALQSDTNNSKVHLLVGDCGRRGDVEQICREFSAREDILNGLVCNAGALTNERTLTSEGFETTFACHLMFGSYWLGKLLMPALHRSGDGRLLFMSSGGMYNTAFPKFEIAASLCGDYNGQMAYAYCKRGQVLLAEYWAKEFPEIKVVSTHPGWTATPGVDSAYGDDKKWLEPMRTLWQGAEGTCWLLVADNAEIVNGSFYLDRAVQRLHMSGAFYSEGNLTKNTPGEVDDMVMALEKYCTLPLDQVAFEQKSDVITYLTKQNPSNIPKLQPMQTLVDTQRYMGSWFVVACIPTSFEVDVVNSKENYEWKGDHIDVKWTYRPKADEPEKLVTQTAWVNPENKMNSEWKIRPFWPLLLPYVILEVDADYSYALVGYPSREYMWLLSRGPRMDKKLYRQIIERLRRDHFYDTSKVVRVPQNWQQLMLRDSRPGVTVDAKKQDGAAAEENIL